MILLRDITKLFEANIIAAEFEYRYRCMYIYCIYLGRVRELRNTPPTPPLRGGIGHLTPLLVDPPPRKGCVGRPPWG